MVSESCFLNSLAVIPMYVFVSLLSVVVTSALYTTLACRPWSWVGHCFWFLQLQRRESFVLVGFVCSLCFFQYCFVMSVDE